MAGILIARLLLASLAVLALGAPAAWAQSPSKGWAILSTGSCPDATRSRETLFLANLFYRQQGDLLGFNLVSPLQVEVERGSSGGGFGTPERVIYKPLAYEDSAGKFQISLHELAAGEWTISRQVIKQSPSNLAWEGKVDFRFNVVAGKVSYLGRFCPMSQDAMQAGLFGKKLMPRNVYLLLSNNAARELELAAAAEPRIKGLEAIDVMPKDPTAVTATWRKTVLEPRVLE